MLVYPESRYSVEEPVDLGSRAQRERLAPSAIRAFFNIVSRWRIRDEDARQLLGGIPSSTFYAMKKSGKRVLDPDTMLRISYMIGIFKALNILHAEKLADRWITMPNKGIIFKGETPLAYMIHGGIPALQIVRRLLDARRGGA